MKEWQKNYIWENLTELQKVTTAHVGLTSRFHGVLDKVDMEQLTVEEDRKGRTGKSALFFTMILEREIPNATETEDLYAKLIQALVDTKQHSANILKDGYIENQRNIKAQSIADIIATNKFSFDINDVADKALDFIDSTEPLDVRVKGREKPFPVACTYDLPPRGKAYALVLNVAQFDDPKLKKRQGSEHDIRYMTNLWSQLGFRVFPEIQEDRENPRKSADEIRKFVKEFGKKCEEDSVDAIAVFLGSHGRNNTIFSSDGVELNVETEFILKLQLNNCKENREKRRAKIFIAQACQDYNPSQEAVILPTHGTTVTDTIYFKAQVSGIKSNRDIYRGSWFVVVLTYALMKNACNYDLETMFKDISALVHAIRTRKFAENRALIQCPPYEVTRFGTLYFLPPRNR